MSNDETNPDQLRRITAWDIEAANLSANFGVILCVGFKDVGRGQAEVLSLQHYGWPQNRDIFRAEKKLLKAVSARLQDSDCWLTHYGSDARFDLPYMNTRLLYHNLPPLDRRFPQIDTWKIAKGGLKLSSNRLGAIQEFFGLKDAKNAIKPGLWIKALSGQKAAMDYIEHHCKLDVLVLEEAYLKLRALVPDHPYVNGIGCRVCGSNRLQSRGYHRTRVRVYRRFQCQDCGAWNRATTPVRRATIT